jgi:uncharacterized LabA/DUF88 family protein
MKSLQVFSISMAAAGACVVAGMITQQPLLRTLGEVMALGVIARKVVLNSRNSELLAVADRQELLRLDRAITRLQSGIAGNQVQSDELEKKLGYYSTSMRLQLSKLNKLQHQQKCLATMIPQRQQRLSGVGGNWSVTAKAERSQQLKPVPLTKKPVTRVYIDGNNFNFAIDALPIEVDYTSLQIELSRTAQASAFKYYTGVQSPVSEGQQRFFGFLERLLFEVVALPIVHRSDANGFKTVGDDVRMAIDMVLEVQSQDRVILVSGDGDFIPAIEVVQGRGAMVTVVGKRGMLSQQLAEIADEVIFLDDIQDKIAKYTKLNVA